jgi:hypothetical protein
MNVYTVHEPPTPPADRLDRADSLVFVKDGFNWAAALFTPFWLLANRMWLVFGGYIGVALLLQLALAVLGVKDRTVTMTVLAMHVLIGFEADTLRRWTLDRAGWRMVGSVVGRGWSDCERRFFEAWLPGEPFIRAEALSPQGGSLPLSGASTRPGRWHLGLPFPRK